MVGAQRARHALLRAQVMISPEADPPVCRVVDYSKYKYEQARGEPVPRADDPCRATLARDSLRVRRVARCALGAQAQKAKEAAKKMASSRQEVKELKMRYNIDTHDYEVRLRAAQRFLKDGDKVKVLCQFRGREMEFKAIALTLFERFIADVKEEGSVEGRPNIEGRSLMMTLVPVKADAAKPAPKPKPPPAAAAAAPVAAPPAAPAPAVAAAAE